MNLSSGPSSAQAECSWPFSCPSLSPCLSFFITKIPEGEQINAAKSSIDAAFAWFTYSGFGSFICFLTISGCVWHALHRVYHGMHDLTIHVNFAHQLICYGLAFIISLIALVACAIRMFS